MDGWHWTGSDDTWMTLSQLGRCLLLGLLGLGFTTRLGWLGFS